MSARSSSQCRLPLYGAETLAEIGIEADVILEPARRDSTAGAAFAHTRYSHGVVLALAADHVVGDAPAFIAACRAGLAATQSGRIVTFGIKPERAAGEYDQLHHFIADGVWDAAPLETELLNQAERVVGGNDAVLVIEDTAVPKKGQHSVGVAAQYASALGKTANCQTLVSLTLALGEVPVMIALRLFLPESWTRDAARLKRVGVPVEYRMPRSKPEIALAEIDRAMAAGVRFGCKLADAGYGLSAPFRQGLTTRGLAWAVGIPRHLKRREPRFAA